MVASPAEIARLIGAQQIPNTSLSSFGPLPTGRPQPKPAPQGAVSPGMQAQLAAAKQRGTAVVPKQDRGFLGDVLGSTIGKAVLKPFEALGVGAAYVGSGVKELADAFAGSGVGHWLSTDPSNVIPDWLMTDKSEAEYKKMTSGSGAASWQQFLDQGSKRKGMGDYVQELNPDSPYAYRLAMGIVGDVATDPLTYVTAGSTKLAGAGARRALSAKALEVTDDAIRLAGSAGRDELIAKANKGAAWLTAAERELLGAPKAGMRFGFGEGIRIAGTGKVADAVGKVTSTVRRGAMLPTRRWETFARGEQYLKQATRVLETGVAEGAMTPTAAAALHAWDAEYRMLKKTAEQQGQKAAQLVLGKMKPEARTLVTHGMEAGTDDTLRPVLDHMRQMALDAGVQIGDIKNYMPHAWTKEARAFLHGAEVDDGAKGFRLNLVGESGQTLKREIKTGSKLTINVDGVPKTVTITDGSIAGINKTLKEAFPDAPVEKFLADDAADIMAGYVSNIASDIGEVGAFRKLLDSKAGVAGSLNDVSSEVLDRVAMRTANKEQAAALRKVLEVRKAAYAAEQKTAQQVAVDLQGEIVRRASASVADLGEIGAKLAADLEGLALKGKSLDEAAKDIVKTVSEYRAAKMKEVYGLQAQLTKIDERIATAKIALDATGGTDVELKAYSDFVRQRAAIDRELKVAQKGAADVEEATARIAEMRAKASEIRANAADPDWMDEAVRNIVIEQASPEMRDLTRAQIEEQLASMPSTNPTALKGAAGKAAKLRAVDVSPAMVTDEMLSRIPQQEADAFRALRAEYDNLRVGRIDASKLEGQKLRDEMASVNERIVAISDEMEQVARTDNPSDHFDGVAALQQERTALVEKGKQLRAQFDALPEGPQGADLRRTRLKEVQAQIDMQTDFITRLDAVVQAGAAESPDTATRVAREVVQSRYNKVNKTDIPKLAKAVESPDSKAMVRVFDDQVDMVMQRYEDLTERLVGLQNLRKAKGLDGSFGGDMNRYAARSAEGGSDAVLFRYELNEMIRHTKAERELERELVAEELQAILGRFPERKVRLGQRARNELQGRAEGSFTIADQIAAGEAGGGDLQAIVDRLRVKGKNEAQRGEFINGPRNDLINELYSTLSPEAHSRLLISAEEELRLATREQIRLGVARQQLGGELAKGQKGTVTADWRKVIFGSDVSLSAERGPLEQALGLYDNAEQGVAAWSEAAAKGYDDMAKKAERSAPYKRKLAASEKAAELQGQRDALPTATEAVQAGAVAQRAPLADELTGLAERRQGVATELDARLAEVDFGRTAQAEQLAGVDQVRKAVEFERTLATQSKAAVDAQLKDVKKLVTRAKGVTAGKADLERTYAQLDELVQQLPGDADLGPIVALQKTYVEQLAKMGAAADSVVDTKHFIDLAKNDKLAANIYTMQLNDGWERVAKNLLSEEDAIAVAPVIAKALDNWQQLSKSNDIWKTYDKMTQFFKTYATMTPGFHIRNALGAVFMNATEGVGYKLHAEAFKNWSQYEHNPLEFMKRIKKTDPQLHDAFKAAFGSGAGGSFSAEELGVEMAKGSKHMAQKLQHNMLTRTSRKAGEWVEGPVRLALALDTTRKGGSAAEALARVTRIHFDYSQLSSMDRGMKRLIPFWTFMSRNLPLQIQQMWMKPRMYAAWNHVVQNMSRGNEFDGVPKWLADKSAIPLGGDSDGNQWMLAPDLAHLNAAEQFKELDPRDPLRMLSALNPMVVAPMEAIANERFRFGSEIGDGGNRVEHMVQQMLPPYAQAQRLLGLGRYEGQADEKWLNYLGVPLQKITPKEQANARRSG